MSCPSPKVDSAPTPTDTFHLAPQDFMVVSFDH